MIRANTPRLAAVVAILAVALTAAPALAEWQAGVAAFQKGDFRNAVAQFEEVTRTNPDYAGAYYMLGLSQSKVGQTDQAIANLRKAAELDAANTQYKVALGQTLAAAGQWGEAYGVLKGVDSSQLEAGARDAHALLLAKAASESGRGADAIRAIEAQLRAGGSDSRLHHALGVAYHAEGQTRKSFDAFRKAYEADPSQSSVGRAAVNAALRMAREDRSQRATAYRQAATIAEQLAQRDPTFEHFVLAGEMRLGAKQYDPALGWFQKARQQQPQNALVCYYTGQSYTSKQAYDQALSELQEALRLGPGPDLKKKIYNQMGFIYAKQRNFDEAISAYRQAGNTARVAEMQKSKQAQAQNVAADREEEEYEQRLKEIQELQEQIEELEGGGL